MRLYRHMRCRQWVLLAIFTLAMGVWPARGARLMEDRGSAAPSEKKAEGEKIGAGQEPSKEKLRSSDKITINFDNADLTTVIKFISELTGKNFLVDDKVKGTVTIFSPTAITVDEAYKVFLSVLEMNGFTVVTSDKVNKIIPSREARSRDITTIKGVRPTGVRREDRVITQIVPLSYADANSLKGMLAPLISKDSMVEAYMPTNSLIINDYASNVHRLLEIVRDMDVEGSQDKVTVIPLQYAGAQTLVNELLSIVEEPSPQRVIRRPTRRGQPRPPEEGAAITVTKLIADERSNSLILVANQPDTQKILNLVELLDQPLPPGRNRIHVYYLENAKAEELLDVLTQLPTKAAAVQTAGPAAPAGAQAPILGEEVQILADKPTNSLVIIASPQDYETLKEVIQKLDIVRSQVLVEALIVDVSLDKAKEIGVEWQFVEDAPHNITTFGGANVSNTPTAGADATPGTVNNLLQTGTFALGVFKGPITIAGQEFLNLSGLIRALQTSSDANILSTPHILTMDNEEAEIIVAENRPFLRSQTGTAESTSTVDEVAQTAVVQTFEFKDVGIILRITPQISRGQFVRLNIFQEVSNVLTESDIAGVFTTAKRQAKTTVVVEDGQTVVIGGLIQDDQRHTQAGVPCLANVPGLGALFRTRSVTDNKRNLLIFITPHILNSPADLAAVSKQKKEESEKAKGRYKEGLSKDVKETLDLIFD
jgi:general secretion pathway protein D